ncbi:type II toxin-antitoxin system HicB family antitoxin [Acetobacter cibinongensis]|uniref:CopG family transcriptional regulator n=1 Tax=Acetobacter cibinongensis TaxID=146475 RepID=A0A1Z5YW42_9PROT|nr:type II toxin-antitoxin system HicB family antitoxin [Acetobacter cibinongensis]OUJ03184.1 CopG family transcriptional regulator [Acetobacter cibinongensis]
MSSYIAIIHKDPESDFGVSFPDFPGCVSAGKTLEEARSMAREALEFHIEGMLEDGEDIPAPSTLDQVMKCPDFASGVAFLVDVRPQAKAVRVNVTLDDNLLSAIAAVSRNRSKFLAEAAWEKLERERA